MRVAKFLRKAVLVLLAMSVPLPCLAADPIGAVEAASVSIAVKGVRDADSAPIEAHGSGFFTNRDGYLVTSYHLVSGLLEKGANEKTLTYSIAINGAGGNEAMEAVLAWKNEAVDLMVLRARIGNRQIHPLRPAMTGRTGLRLTETPVFTGGYPGGYEFLADRGYIKSFEGPADAAAPTWVTNMSFKEGQSGSPVVTEDGRVVAVVKAVDLEAASIGILVPIGDIPTNYWQNADADPQISLAGFTFDGLSGAWQLLLTAITLLIAAAAFFLRNSLTHSATRKKKHPHRRYAGALTSRSPKRPHATASSGSPKLKAVPVLRNVGQQSSS